MGNRINVTQDGKTFAIDEDQIDDARRQGFHVEGDDEAASRVQDTLNQERFGGTAGGVVATGLGLARSATGGLSDAALRMVGGEGAAQDIAAIRDAHPYLSTGAEIGGAVLDPFGAGSLATRAGARAARGLEEGGALAQIAGAGVKAGTEGVFYGGGEGVSEVALSKDQISIERAASVIGSRALFGGLTGGALGVAGKTVEKGLARAKSSLDRYAEKGVDLVGDAATADISKLDRKGLRVAEKAELDTIEKARVPQRAQLADDIKALRSEMKQQKIWLATKDADVKAIPEIREVGKVALEADRSIDRMLRNPKALAERPQRVLDGLQQQEHALERLVGQADNLKPIYAADATGVRQAAFDYASTALEKNRALQAKIGELTAKPMSPRLEAIADRMAGGGQQAAQQGLGSALTDAGVGYALGAAAGVPLLGPAIAAAKLGMGIAKKLGVNTAEAAARGSKAIQTFLDVGTKVAPRAKVIATKTLSSVAYGQVADLPKATARIRKGSALAESFNARSRELRSLTAPGPDGAPMMRPEARAQIAEHLTPIRAVSPVLADRIETNKASAIEFLAGKLPKKPDLPGVDGHWPHSDMEMRTFARYVAAVEDPHGVIERLASGDVTPEDAEAMRTVYPEMYAQVQQEIMGQLGEIRSKLPYQRRLALSVFSGVPCDPVLDPRVLAALQGSFAAEPGTDGGVQAPRAQPAFGSVSKPQATPAQERGAGGSA